MQNPTEGKHRLSIRRRMPATRDVVFEAWTDPQGLREWMCPGDTFAAEATLTATTTIFGPGGPVSTTSTVKVTESDVFTVTVTPPAPGPGADLCRCAQLLSYDTRAIRSSTLERNSFRSGDLFSL